MTKIYCDAAEKHMIFAWGCVILHDREIHTFSGNCQMHAMLEYGGLYAVYEALERLAQFEDIGEGHEVELFTEEINLVYAYNALKGGGDVYTSRLFGRYVKRICKYSLKYNLELTKISKGQNLAHDIVYEELEEALGNPPKVPPLVMPDFLAPPRVTPHTVISKSLPQSLKRQKDYNARLIHVLEIGSQREAFDKLLRNDGINISSLYHILKNRFPKYMSSYKQNGEKKLHLSFARALEGSRFCVCEISGLFYAFYDGYQPEGAKLIRCEEKEGATG